MLTDMVKATARRRTPSDTKAARAREGMRKHRDDMRRRGFKLVQIWVPDPMAPGFAAELQRQIRSLAARPDRGADDFSAAALSDVWNDPEWKP
jgi:hypothetical protein